MKRVKLKFIKHKTILFLIVVFCEVLFIRPIFAKSRRIITPAQEYKHQQKILRQEEIEKYKRSLLPKSGCMTREEYEQKSQDISNADRIIPEYKFPKNTNMKYVPQPFYELAHYNDPPGATELYLSRRFHFDRQENGGAITSPNMDILVYPVVYYYANNQCGAGDLFVIPLDKKLTGINRILRANIIKRNPNPILSTSKDISEKFIFRTLTPIDFSPDGSKLIAKEKIGNINDGIWKTNLWVYDFKTRHALELTEIRDAIKFYWLNTKGLALDEKRWDIIPLGFDAQNPQRIVVSAYGYTGKAPKFLGNWSIDCTGERTQLLSLFDSKMRISANGLKALQTGVVDPAEALENEKMQEKLLKKKRKKIKQARKQELKKKKQILNAKLKEMKKEESSVLNQYRIQHRTIAPTSMGPLHK